MSNECGGKMIKVNALRSTNLIIYILTLLGAFLALFLLEAVACVDYCFTDYPDYAINFEIIALSIAVALVSTLTYQVVNVFALHVEKSHSK